MYASLSLNCNSETDLADDKRVTYIITGLCDCLHVLETSVNSSFI